MQKVPLRVFYRTIDDLILNQQSDAAISRSKCLLQEFPKNLSVYQLLGKAFLDKQEFDDANTVFEKILEIDPDDFVSHIGISIISESFGNLDKALESMRRAYELQPSNESLQNEV
ncbi:MAG: tetratricopeptide repeat protein, partial [Pelolinea sp.]|nr:tetratricopeptide repeat protein [Pelolinea sp.]